MDVEAAHVEERSAFGRTLAVLVGMAGLAAALLGALQMDASTRQARAQAEGARLSVAVFEGLAVQGIVSSFELGSMQSSIVPTVEGLARSIEGLEAPEIAGYQDALAAAHQAAGVRIVQVAREMSAPPGPGSALDPHTREVLALVPDLSDLFDAIGRGELPERSPEEVVAGGREAFDRMVAEQNRRVDLAERLGSRSDRAVLALSLLALSAVLLGLAGVIGRGTPGWIALGSGAVAMGLSVAAGVSALLV